MGPRIRLLRKFWSTEMAWRFRRSRLICWVALLLSIREADTRWLVTNWDNTSEFGKICSQICKITAPFSFTFSSFSCPSFCLLFFLIFAPFFSSFSTNSCFSLFLLFLHFFLFLFLLSAPLSSSYPIFILFFLFLLLSSLFFLILTLSWPSVIF